MAAQAFYLIGFLLVVLLIAVFAYYGWRLVTVRREQDDSERRLQEYIHQQSSPPPVPPRLRAAAPEAAPPAAPDTEPAARWSTPSAAGATRVYDKRLALSEISPEPIFMRRSRSGEVELQIEGSRPMPLKYVLDPKVRAALQAVASQVTVDLGPWWAIVASDDEQGRLSITRLS